MLIFVVIILCLNQVWQVDSSDIPKSHIPVLEELLEKYLNKTRPSQNSIVDFLFGDINTTTDGTGKDLDVNILDLKNLQKIIETETVLKYNETRRYENPFIVVRDRNPKLVSKTFELMRQSIYTARYRLAETKVLRIKFREDNPYNIGIVVANVYQLILKCEHMYNQMVNYKEHSFFLWRLTLYTKILACHTDVENLVQRAFMYQKQQADADNQLNDLFGNGDGAETIPQNKMPPFTMTTGHPGVTGSRRPGVPNHPPEGRVPEGYGRK